MAQPSRREDGIVDAALALPAAERSGFVAQACGDDAQLRSKVEALLLAYARAGAVLQTESGKPTASSGTFEKPGDRIGRYKLLQKLGEGGCGSVYMAEQHEPVKRLVALKIVKLGMDTKEVITRFEAERQALALMDHPNIAQVLDGGTTDTGRPFFVMELVRGIPITRFCDENQLDTPQRLGLFVQVCQAVQHAHQKGIIHRDLKPANVLVADHDGVPVPKVIDFGIAKATAGQTLTDKTLFTAFEQFIGTPAYMSPEQAKLSGLDIDTRSDIYSLGVLLYELLTGNTPFDSKRLVQAGLEEVCRIIREEEPPRPSTRLNTLQIAEQTTVARHRQSDPPKLLGLLRGDLDWIVMKALEKDRSRRYETANGLARDIERHLNNEPVVARPPSRGYRLQKLVRRNQVAFTAAMAVVLALATGLALSTWLFFREVAARKQAKDEANKSQQVAQFLKSMLTGVDPAVAKGRDTALLKQILDSTSRHLEQELKGQPEVEAELRATLGAVYQALSLLAEAETMFNQALTLRMKVHGSTSREVADALRDLGGVLYYQRKLAPAEDALRRALEIYKSRLGAESQELAACLNDLANVRQMRGELGEAERLHREALAMKLKVFGPNHTEVADSLANLGNVLDQQGHFQDAEKMARDALAIRQAISGPDDPRAAESLNDLGSILAHQNKLEEAVTLQTQALELRKRILGGAHTGIANSLNDLAVVLWQAGKLPEAEARFREAIEMERQLHGNDAPNLPYELSNLAGVLQGQDKLSEAKPPLREALRIFTQILEPDNPLVAVALGNLTALLLRLNEPLEAEQRAAQALDIWKKKRPDYHERFNAEYLLGAALLAQKKYTEAEPLLLSGYNGMKQREAQIPAHPRTRARLGNSLAKLVELYEATGRPSEAANWRTKLDEFKQTEAQKQSALKP